jgi:hypothetical protein
VRDVTCRLIIIVVFCLRVVPLLSYSVLEMETNIDALLAQLQDGDVSAVEKVGDLCREGINVRWRSSVVPLTLLCFARGESSLMRTYDTPLTQVAGLAIKLDHEAIGSSSDCQFMFQPRRQQEGLQPKCTIAGGTG